MSILPDELWSRILELGAKTSRLDYRDLCSIAIVSRRFSYLSSDPALWSILLALDFPQSSSSPSTLPPKSTYKIRFERDKARKVLLWRRAVLTAESQVAVSEKRLRELESLIVKEMERLKVVGDELSNLERARHAAVALNVWQPEVVRSSHVEIVGQCTVPIDSRLSTLRMEFKVCKQQIGVYKKALNDENLRLSERKEKLTSVKYHPLQSYHTSNTNDNGNVKRKKLKQCTECLQHNV
ncbi:F-box protein SKIP24 isoform X1 [Dioscorea cayenensis subsp. rotundata]|uniref:F-box protein SKIP24 isoform X1 n=2 Tax=Dioscorea cayennensis subsp. rotundata TaxID=55577 RepID=A0AB40BZ74_DIOCR|nr:F-box protein SKIP24 isoform X1 [Dioscorea cayenensis subsp. rotundata]